MSKYLGRDDAPFDESLWEKIDKTVAGAARSQLAGRRLLHVDGPHGLGLKFLPGKEEEVAEGGGVSILASSPVPIANLSTGFRLPRRDLAATESNGAPLDLSPAAQAAVACARQEDDLIFQGNKALGADGLLTAKGVQSVKLGDWSGVGVAADDVIKAMTKLDQAGFHGPYSLALAPDRFNQLYRRYQQGNMSEMDHVRQMITEGVIKAPAIQSGGLVIASGRQYASIALGQDLMTGFIGPADQDYEFTVSETVALMLLCPEAVCVLK